MLYSHVRETQPKEIAQEFPKLARYERKKWETSDFHTAFFKQQPEPISAAISQSLPIIELRREKVNPVSLPRYTGDSVRPRSLTVEETKTWDGIRTLVGADLNDLVLTTKKKFIDDELDTLRISSVSELEEGKLDKDISASTLVVLAHVDIGTGALLLVEKVVLDIRLVKQDVKIALNVSESIGIEDVEFQKWDVDILFAELKLEVTLAVVKESVDTSSWQDVENRTQLVEELKKALAALLLRDKVDPEGDSDELRCQLGGAAAEYLQKSKAFTVVRNDDLTAQLVRHYKGLLHEQVVETDELLSQTLQ